MVEIVWNDAASLTEGWTDELDPDEPHLAISVGFLIRETKEHVVIAQDIDASRNHNGRSQIPKGMVKQMRVLKKKDKEQ